MIDGSPASREISLTVQWLWGLSYWLSDSTVSTFSSVCALRLPLTGCLSAVPDFTSSLLMLFFVQPLFRNFVINCREMQPLHSYRFLIKILSSLRNGVKVGAFAWYSDKIRVIFGVRFERRKVDKKKQTYMKTETCRLYSRVFWIFLPNIIKIDPYNFELYRFKVGSFFETQCIFADFILLSQNEVYIIVLSQLKN